MAGGRVVRTEGTRVLFERDAGADAQAILRAALATGPVRRARRRVPESARE